MSIIARRLAARAGDHVTPAEELPRRPRRPSQRSPEMQSALDYMAAHPLDTTPGEYAPRLDDTPSRLERLLGGAR